MEILNIYLNLLLASVLLIAAVGKFLDLPGSRKAAAEFGTPAAFAGLVGSFLPVIEAAIGLLLILGFYSATALLCAIGLFAIFTILMTVQKIRGNAPDCHCFGAVGSEPVGISSILRNAGFIGIALVALLTMGERGVDSVFDLGPEISLPLIGSAVLPVLLLLSISKLMSLSGKISQLTLKLESLEGVLDGEASSERAGIGHPEDGVPVGAPIPQFSAFSVLHRDRVELSSELRSGNHVIVFVGPDCGPCGSMLPDLISLKDEFNGRLNVVLVSEGDVERNIEKFRDFGLENLFLQDSKEVSSLFLARWTPMAVLVSGGRVASAVAAGELSIRRLFEFQAGRDFATQVLLAGAGIPRSRYKVGESVPDFHTFSVDGEGIKASDFMGEGGLVVFTNDSCPHCDIVADAVASIRGSNGSGPSRILFMNSGDPSKLVDKGLGDITVVDEDHMLGRRIGAFGAPSAVLIDAEGKIASETAVGSVAIKALFGIYGSGLR